MCHFSNVAQLQIKYNDFDRIRRFVYITLDGNFSNVGRSISRRRGNVPVLVIGNGSEHPIFTNISTNVLVASTVFNFKAFESTPDFNSFVKCVEANDKAAFA